MFSVLPTRFVKEEELDADIFFPQKIYDQPLKCTISHEFCCPLKPLLLAIIPLVPEYAMIQLEQKNVIFHAFTYHSEIVTCVLRVETLTIHPERTIPIRDMVSPEKSGESFSMVRFDCGKICALLLSRNPIITRSSEDIVGPAVVMVSYW